jgi:hypothetical protein
VVVTLGAAKAATGALGTGFAAPRSSGGQRLQWVMNHCISLRERKALPKISAQSLRSVRGTASAEAPFSDAPEVPMQPITRIKNSERNASGRFIASVSAAKAMRSIDESAAALARQYRFQCVAQP